MANANAKLIDALRKTANRLKDGAHYSWGNHGACNCGNLLQSITSLSEGEILSYAHSGIGEWTELAEDYCGDTNVPVSLLINKLTILGLTPGDIHNIEYLEDREVLKALPGGFRWLKRNVREDVILYFETFAGILEERLQHAAKQLSAISHQLSAVSHQPSAISSPIMADEHWYASS